MSELTPESILNPVNLDSAMEYANSAPIGPRVVSIRQVIHIQNHPRDHRKSAPDSRNFHSLEEHYLRLSRAPQLSEACVSLEQISTSRLGNPATKKRSICFELERFRGKLTLPVNEDVLCLDRLCPADTLARNLPAVHPLSRSGHIVLFGR